MPCWDLITVVNAKFAVVRSCKMSVMPSALCLILSGWTFSIVSVQLVIVKLNNLKSLQCYTSWMILCGKLDKERKSLNEVMQKNYEHRKRLYQAITHAVNIPNDFCIRLPITITTAYLPSRVRSVSTLHESVAKLRTWSSRKYAH